MLEAPAAAPWVGHKGSGFGFHSGLDGWRQFSVPKTVTFSSVEDLKAATSVATAEVTARL
jgi:hypothetical protein